MRLEQRAGRMPTAGDQRRKDAVGRGARVRGAARRQEQTCERVQRELRRDHAGHADQDELRPVQPEPIDAGCTRELEARREPKDDGREQQNSAQLRRFGQLRLGELVHHALGDQRHEREAHGERARDVCGHTGSRRRSGRPQHPYREPDKQRARSDDDCLTLARGEARVGERPSARAACCSCAAGSSE